MLPRPARRVRCEVIELFVAAARERAPGERRVALVPDTVAALVRQGYQVGVEAGAGAAAHLTDGAYREAGADVADDVGRLVERADVLVSVGLPDADTVGPLRPGRLLVGLLAPVTRPERMAELAAQGLTAFSLDAMPRVTRAQSMDVLSAMSTVACYRAAILGAEYAGRFLSLLMTAAGTVPPARVLVLGAGVAGLQAVATARRLGAVVEAFDARPAVKEQVESLGASFLAPPGLTAEGSGGYARSLAADEEAREREFLAAPVAQADVVIATAMVPGMKAPTLIDEAMVSAMRPGSVIVDVAAAAGGNCALTAPGERIVTAGGVTIEGATDLVSQMALPASQLMSRNLLAFLRLLWQEGLGEHQEGEDAAAALRLGDEILSATLICHGGSVVHEPTLDRLAAASAR